MPRVFTTAVKTCKINKRILRSEIVVHKFLWDRGIDMVKDEQNYLVSVDYYGDISTNQQSSFWFPQGKGTLFVYNDELRFKNISDAMNTVDINFNKIIKVKMISLNPKLNPWIKGFWGSPYYLLFWIPFWNNSLVNITYLDQKGNPRELFFKLKTEKSTKETVAILRDKLRLSLNE